MPVYAGLKPPNKPCRSSGSNARLLATLLALSFLTVSTSHQLLLDLAPEHSQRFLDRLLGVLGSFCFFLESRFLMPNERAQYAIVTGKRKGKKRGK